MISNKFILILLLFNLCYNECIIHSFPDLHYPKAFTLENGYHLIVTSTGIYTFYPKLSKFSSSYNFTEEQIISTNIYGFQNTINQNQISQFLDNEEGKEYIVCLVKSFLYFMDEKGKIILIEKLSNINAKFILSLIAYKYNNGNYYFVLAYNFKDNVDNKYLGLYYYKIDYNKLEITLESFNEILPTFNEIKYVINPYSISCQNMKSLTYGKVLTCFQGISNFKSIVAFNLNPDNNFELLFKSELYPDSDNYDINYIKTSINSDNSKAFICFTHQSPNKLKCIYYDINENKFFNISSSTKCNIEYFGFNLNYFMSSNEYVLSCLDYNLGNLYIYRLNEDFSIINDNKNYKQTSFLNCYTYDFFSIIYLSKYEEYSVVVNSNCNAGNNMRIYILTNQNCIIPENEIEDEEDFKTQNTLVISPRTTILKSNKMTIPLTIKDSTSVTTIQKLIKTTLPKPIINTILETKITKINKTTSPKTIISQTIYIPLETIITKKNKITILNISSTTTESTQKYLCQDSNKIYYNGKCICDKKKGYYSINFHSLDNKCYKKRDIPRNTYFNNITQTYEICYKTCGTCIKGGDSFENNCLTCAYNYIKETDNNSSNCVENCQYLYYYNTLKQYSCTEDEQCPSEASLIVRTKGKCINKCTNDDTNKFRYNGECLSSCPINTKSNEYYICQLNNISICTFSESELNLEESITQENVKLVAQNYATEFYYTVNHISKFTSPNFTMVLYKNNSCIDELKLNITKIEFDSCIQQLKKDNKIDEHKELIIAVIDLVSGNNPITSFGFFNPDTGEKLDALKSCSDKNVMIYENLISILNDPFAIKLLEEQKINIFDLKNEFYTNICFHFNSPNGRDSTLQDRIKTFYPNITLCDPGCRNKGINLTTMKAECECTFQDLLIKSIFENNLFGNNILIKESIGQIEEMLNNLNLEILTCYKEVFDYKYFKKNIGGFIIIAIFIFYTIFIVYYIITKNDLLRYLYSLTKKYILYISKNCDNKNISKINNIPNSPIKKDKNNYNYKKENEKNKEKDKNNKIDKNKKYEIKEKNKDKYKEINKKIFNDKKCNKYKINNKEKSKINFKQINILNLNFKTPKNEKKSKENINNSRSSARLNNYIKTEKIINNNNIIKSKKYDFVLLYNDTDIQKFLEPTFDGMDYDDVIEQDKRTFCKYFCEKIKENQMIINTFFISDYLKPRSIKIAIFIFMIDIYFLINGLFYSDSFISEIFNSNEEETFLRFIRRLLNRFLYSIIIIRITGYIINLFFVEKINIKKILLSNQKDILKLKYEITEIIRIIIKRIKILISINYIIIIFSWYYLSCFNNVYPHINKELIISTIFIFISMQIIPLIFTFIEACIRFISIKYESEKLFKLSLLFP